MLHHLATEKYFLVGDDITTSQVSTTNLDVWEQASVMLLKAGADPNLRNRDGVTAAGLLRMTEEGIENLRKKHDNNPHLS